MPKQITQSSVEITKIELAPPEEAGGDPSTVLNFIVRDDLGQLIRNDALEIWSDLPGVVRQKLVSVYGDLMTYLKARELNE